MEPSTSAATAKERAHTAALSSIGLLEISPQHTYAVADLPFHHRDPFDRLLAAQCLSEGLTLISSDAVFEKYGVERVW